MQTYPRDDVACFSLAVQIQAVRIVAGQISHIKGAILGGAVTGLDHRVVQIETIHGLVNYCHTKIASEASLSSENVMYAE